MQIYEDQQINERRLAIIEESIHRSLLYDEDIDKSYKNSSNCLIYFSLCLLTIIIIAALIIVFVYLYT